MTAYYHLLKRTTDTNHNTLTTTAHYQSTPDTQGAWNDHEQHIAPVTGVICHEMEHYHPHDHMRIGRISIDILGVIPLGEITIATTTIRGGRTIELIESTVSANGRNYVIAKAWRMLTSDSSEVQGLEDDNITHPDTLPATHALSRWDGGFIGTLTTRAESSNQSETGLVWVTTGIDMVAEEQSSDFVKLMSMVDIANGIAPRIAPTDDSWIYPNLDLQIHMHRLPQGQWLGIESIQQIGEDGIGLTSAILHDIQGVFGRSEQILTVRKIDKDS